MLNLRGTWFALVVDVAWRSSASALLGMDLNKAARIRKDSTQFHCSVKLETSNWTN